MLSSVLSLVNETLFHLDQDEVGDLAIDDYSISSQGQFNSVIVVHYT